MKSFAREERRAPQVDSIEEYCSARWESTTSMRPLLRSLCPPFARISFRWSPDIRGENPRLPENSYQTRLGSPVSRPMHSKSLGTCADAATENRCIISAGAEGWKTESRCKKRGANKGTEQKWVALRDSGEKNSPILFLTLLQNLSDDSKRIERGGRKCRRERKEAVKKKKKRKRDGSEELVEKRGRGEEQPAAHAGRVCFARCFYSGEARCRRTVCPKVGQVSMAVLQSWLPVCVCMRAPPANAHATSVHRCNVAAALFYLWTMRGERRVATQRKPLFSFLSFELLSLTFFLPLFPALLDPVDPLLHRCPWFSLDHHPTESLPHRVNEPFGSWSAPIPLFSPLRPAFAKLRIMCLSTGYSASPETRASWTGKEKRKETRERDANSRLCFRDNRRISVVVDGST